ncbi:MAG: HAMP domain-containing histidine kinase [Oscillospiraceae bacterium]|nr:HAMP domain-containing histidine kinase [Oscillospiraceae bacterium]
MKLSMDKLKLKWKIFALMLGFCALLLIILWLSQTVFLNDMYKYIRGRELADAIAMVEEEIGNPELPEILFYLQAENDIIIAPARDFAPPPRPGIPRMERPGRWGDPPFESITETHEFTLGDGQTISLTFYALLTPVNATVSTLRIQLYWITGVMVVLSVLLAIVIAKRVSKPIEEISGTASHLAKGNYNIRFAGKGFYEIVALSDTLNTAAAELGKVEGLRRELLANVSHDLRTPLSLIYSYAEMMHDFPDEITPEQSQVIMDETQRLSALVNDVLDISKLENNMEQLNISDFNLTQNILDCVQRMNELLCNKNYKITFLYDNEIYISADGPKIGRAFYNLLINAVNYCGDDKAVSVSQAIEGNSVRISVTDSGDGIAQADLPYVWDRYYKSGTKHRRAITGTGLGLSIVKKIIELHDGSYGVISEIGKGSTFWFEI